VNYLPTGKPSTPPEVLAARPGLIRVINEQLILEQIRRLGKVARRDLGKISGLSKPTVAVALANLERNGLIRTAGKSSGARGPAAVLYEVRPEAGFILGLDVGREYVRGAIADLSGAIRARGSRKVHAASRAGRLSHIVGLADELTGQVPIERSDVTQTIVGSPGVYNSGRGVLSMARGLPGWERPGVLAELWDAFGEHTIVENDVNLAALAERDLGHGRGVSDFAFVSVGTGIGLGLVIGGKLHRGVHGAAGEIGYLPLGDDRDVDPDDARRRGRLESVASAAGIVRAARRSGMRGTVTARRVFAGAERGDTLCRSIVAEEAILVSRAIASVTAVVDPALVVLGGGIGHVPYFVEETERELRKLMTPPIPVRASALGEAAVVDGCLAAGMDLAWQRVVQR